MNKLTLLVITLTGLVTGYLFSHYASSHIHARFNTDTQAHISTFRDIAFTIDINAGLELKEDGQFEYYFVIPKDIGFSAVGHYTLNAGLLSLNITESEPLLVEADNKKPLALYEKLVSRVEMHTTENMLVFKPTHDKQALVLFSERGAFYYKPRQ